MKKTDDHPENVSPEKLNRIARNQTRVKNIVYKSSTRNPKTGEVTPLPWNKRGLGAVPFRRDQKLSLKDENALWRWLDVKAEQAELARERAARMPDIFRICKAPPPAVSDESWDSF